MFLIVPLPCQHWYHWQCCQGGWAAAAAFHGIVRVLVVWRRWGERAAAGVPWQLEVAAFQRPHGNVAWVSLATGREGGSGGGRATAFWGAQRPCGGRAREQQWALQLLLLAQIWDFS